MLHAVEQHIGVEPHRYSDVRRRINVAGCYGWTKEERGEWCRRAHEGGGAREKETRASIVAPPSLGGTDQAA